MVQGSCLGVSIITTAAIGRTREIHAVDVGQELSYVLQNILATPVQLHPARTDNTVSGREEDIDA